MKASSARKNILKKIKQALEKPVPLPFNEEKEWGFSTIADDLEILFAENFTSLQGRFSFCSDKKELVEQLQTLLTTRKWNKLFINEPILKNELKASGLENKLDSGLAECDASITTCEYLIARTGSIVLSSAQQGRTSSVYAPVHICVAYTNQLMYDIRDGLDSIQKKYTNGLPSLISFASGPSRTADIEKTLVTGVHGPKEVFCFLVQS
ncbi:MAG: LUD domain-containing protein [Bacteroidetes bacterium]|nr:LUD domain-containing protein [Bacteroidota bacterium]